MQAQFDDFDAQVQCDELTYDYVPTAQDMADAMEDDTCDEGRDKMIDQYISMHYRAYGYYPDMDKVLNMQTDDIQLETEAMYERIVEDRYY